MKIPSVDFDRIVSTHLKKYTQKNVQETFTYMEREALGYLLSEHFFIFMYTI